MGVTTCPFPLTPRHSGPRSPWQHEFDLPNASITEIEFWPMGRIVDGAPRYAVLPRIGDARHLGTDVSDM